MRRAKLAMWTVVICTAMVAAPSSAQQYDVTKSVPDVDKVPPGPMPDNSCWQACAANLLGGAGWGLAANTPQQNADAIYGHMNAKFGLANFGDPALAINWWLYEYGYNPSRPGGWYRPTLTYNDVTTLNKQLKNVDYDFLLDEVERRQYVGVQWTTPVGDHCMTLIGGNYAGNPNGKPTGNVSLWHDSDRDVGNGPTPPDDDLYGNAFDAAGNWTLPGYPTLNGTGFVTLCPGVQKPASAMENYDAAYFRDQNLAGAVSKVWRIAGSAQYGQPVWQQDQDQKWTVLHVPNEELPDLHKEVYLLIDFKGRAYDPTNPNAADPPDISLLDSAGTTWDEPEVTISADGGQLLYKWVLDTQPAWEDILFPTEDYYNLAGDVKDFNIATQCVPEPVTLALLSAGAVALIRRKR